MNRPLLLLSVTLSLLSLARADQFATGQPASSVLGQPDLVSGSSGSAPNRLKYPEAVAVDPTTGKVFVADSGNYRILRFSSTAALSSGSFPEAVIGQPNFTANSLNQGGAAGANTLGFGYQITVDRNGRLWVADTENHRVLCFVAASFLANNPPADYVFGQPNFTTVTAGTTVAKMNNPGGVAIGPDDSLWVADIDNHRVLRFGDISGKASGANANNVLGQAGFNTDTPATSATAMSAPFSVSVDSSGRLWVADTSNRRVLRFDNAAALANGSPANGVLGQVNFTNALVGTNSISLAGPYGVLAGPDGTVYVGDYSNGRIMGFRNAASKANGAAADFVLGQPDFNTGLVGPTSALLAGPANVSLSPQGHLFVADYTDNRVVRFVPVPSPAVTIQTKKSTTSSATFAIKGTATGQVTKVTYRVGKSGPFKSAKGTAAWSFKAKLKSGKNLITVIAEGPGGTSASKTVTITRN
jgi:sugar lactone lactonase YvrE